MTLSGNLLIIDDSRSARIIIRRDLSAAAPGLKFLEAGGMDEGLQVLKNNPVSMVMIDYNMPEHNGIEVAREILSLNPSIPVALFTGNIQDHIREEAEALGIAFFEKPLKAATIEAILSYFSQH